MLGVVLAAGLAITAGSAPADAQDVVAVAPLQVSGDLPPRWTQALRKAVDRGLQRGKFGTTSLDAECADARCWAHEAEGSSAKNVVVVSVHESYKVYELQAQIVRVRDAKVVATTNDTCEVCGLADVEERTEALAATLRDRLDAGTEGPPRLLVRSDPPGARVLVDGVEVGTTPMSYEGTEGQHRLRVELPGHAPAERDLKLVEGVDETLDLQLVEQKGLGPSDPSGGDVPDAWARTRPLVISGWTALGVGLASVATGVALLVINDDQVQSKCSGNDLDVNGNCRYLYDTKTGGIAAASAGAAFVVAGAVLLGVGYRRRARLTLGPRSVGLEVRF
jgi:hypothetical protein